MGPALTYRLALIGEGAKSDRSNHVWMALAVSFGASVLGALLVLAIAQTYFQRSASVPSELKAELWSALPLLAVLLPLGTISTVLSGALQGRGRFGALATIGVLNAALVASAPLFAALAVNTKLPTLILAMVFANALILLIQIAACVHLVPLQLPLRLRREQLKGLFGYGAWMSTTALVAPFLLLFDRFVIGGLRGATAVAVYVLAFSVMQGLLIVPASLNRAMLPRLAPLRTEDEVRQLQSSSLLGLSGLLTPLSIASMAVVGPFFYVWIGPDLERMTSPVAVLLLVGGWLHGIGHIPSAVVVGRRRPDLLTKLLLACLLPYLLLLYIATASFGVIGAAMAWTIRAAFDPLLFLYTRPNASDIWSVAISAALTIAAMAVVLMLAWSTLLYWAAIGVIFAIACYHNRAVIIPLFGHFQTAARRFI